MNHRNRDQPTIVDGQFLEPGCDGSAFFQPANAALNDIPGAIGQPIIAHWSPRSPATQAFAWGNHRANAPLAQPVSNTPRVIAFIAGHLLRSRSRTAPALRNDDLGHQPFKRRCLVGLPSRDADGEGDSPAIDDEMEFSSEAATGSTERMIGRFVGIESFFFRAPAAARLARICVPSMFHCCQSRWPFWSSCA